MSIDAVMVLLLLLQKKFKFDPITEYLYGTIPVPYKYFEITTRAVPRYNIFWIWYHMLDTLPYGTKHTTPYPKIRLDFFSSKK